MSIFDERILLTPFGLATCWERIDAPDASFWICWPHETAICFWFKNQEVRAAADWSLGRYTPMPFKLEPQRIEKMAPLGNMHTYWREHIATVSSHNRSEDQA